MVKDYLSFGQIYPQTVRASAFRVRTLTDINTFIALLESSNFMFYGAKSLDYRDFKQCIDIMNKREHLTENGIKRLKIITNRMNSVNRTEFSL